MQCVRELHIACCCASASRGFPKHTYCFRGTLTLGCFRTVFPDSYYSFGKAFFEKGKNESACPARQRNTKTVCGLGVVDACSVCVCCVRVCAFSLCVPACSNILCLISSTGTRKNEKESYYSFFPFSFLFSLFPFFLPCSITHLLTFIPLLFQLLPYEFHQHISGVLFQCSANNIPSCCPVSEHTC